MVPEMLRDGPMWLSLGVVRSPPIPSTAPGGTTAARRVLVQLMPSQGFVDARVAHPGQGIGKGVFAPLQVNDEVLVVFPSSSPQNAVVLAGLGNAKNPNPLDNLELAMLLLHPGGIQLSALDGAPQNGIVHAQFLASLSPYMTALEAFIFACSTAVTAANVATAALAFMTAVQQVGPAPSPFAAQVAASGVVSGTGFGAPPFATALHKVSTP